MVKRKEILLFIGMVIEYQVIQTLCCNSFSDYCDNFEEDYVNSNGEDDLYLQTKPRFSNNQEFDNTSTRDSDRRTKRSPDSIQDPEKISQHVSTILDGLLVNSGYDKQLRPQISGKAIQVTQNAVK